MKLTARQLRFVIEYAKLGHQTNAAIAAGYAKRGAHVTASRLLRLPKIQAELERRRNRIQERAEVSAATVLQRLTEHVDVDPSDLFDAEGRLKPLSEIPLAARRRIAGIEVVELRDRDGNVTGHVRKIKLTDPLRALELQGKHKAVDAFTKDVEVNVPTVVVRDYTKKGRDDGG